MLQASRLLRCSQAAVHSPFDIFSSSSCSSLALGRFYIYHAMMHGYMKIMSMPFKRQLSFNTNGGHDTTILKGSSSFSAAFSTRRRSSAQLQPSLSTMERQGMRRALESKPYAELSPEQQKQIDTSFDFWDECLRYWVDHKDWKSFHRSVPAVTEWIEFAASSFTHPDCQGAAFQLVRGFIVSSDLKGAISLMDAMTSSSSPVNYLGQSSKSRVTLLNQMVQQAMQLRDVALAKSLLVRARRDWNAVPDAFTYNSIFHGLLSIRDPKLVDEKDAAWREAEAAQFLLEMKKDGIAPNIYLYTIFINYHACRGQMKHVMAIIAEMKERGIEMNKVTVGVIVRGCVRSGNLKQAREVFDQFRSSIDIDPQLVTPLMTGYCDTGDFASAMEFLHEVHEMNVAPPVIAEMVSSLVHHAAQVGQYEQALQSLKQMVQWGIRPTEDIYSALASGMASNKDVKHGLQIVNDMIALGMCPDAAVFGTLLSLLASMKQMDDAEKLFQQAKALNVVNSQHYSTFINGFIRQHNLPKAFHYIDEMRQQPALFRFTSAFFFSLLKFYGEFFRLHDPRLYQQIISISNRLSAAKDHVYDTLLLNDGEQKVAEAMLRLLRPG